MSLARTLLNGGSVGMGDVVIESARYGHAEGASIIAMESIEELHEIFMESYNYEQAEIAAATEGVALEGSQFEAVAEAAISNGFAKVKEFLQKLWKKVKEFFHNVRRFLDSIFLSGKEFVKKYKKDIAAIRNLDDFSYTMYKYNDDAIEKMTEKIDVEEGSKSIVAGFDAVLKLLTSSKDSDADFIKSVDETIESTKKELEPDHLASLMTVGKCKSDDDYDEFMYELFRGDDKEDRELSVSDITQFANTLETSKALASLDKQAKANDSVYNKAIKLVEKLESEAIKSMKSEGASAARTSKVAEYARVATSGISKGQNLTNRAINIWKSVVKERDAAYKSAIMAALSYDKKASKKK